MAAMRYIGINRKIIVPIFIFFRRFSLTTFFFPVFLTEAALLFIITEINHFSELRNKACPQFLPFIISNPFSFLKSIIKIF